MACNHGVAQKMFLANKGMPVKRDFADGVV
jgi:hypothetical protein